MAKATPKTPAQEPPAQDAVPKRAAGKGERSPTTRSKALLVGAKPTLLADGSPQIAKAEGDAPVQAAMRSREQATGEPASRLIDQRSRDLGGWRGETLARMRALILQADPEVVEEWKWMGTPVWSRHGIICTGETYKKVVKLTFARGARIPDPKHLFNSSLEGNTRRAIDIHEGGMVEAGAFQTLVKAAVAQNGLLTKKTKPGA